MDPTMAIIAALAGGFVAGLLVTYLLMHRAHARALARMAQEHAQERAAQQAQWDAERQGLNGQMREAFAALAAETLSQSQRDLMALADNRFMIQQRQHDATLDQKRQLIDQRLDTMNRELDKVTQLVREFEGARAEKLGALGGEIERLSQSNLALQQALADNRARGQWGERMAEDVLRLAGMIEGINYRRQQTFTTPDGRNRPDYTFLLPNDLVLNMDVKFPLDRYIDYLHAEDAGLRTQHRDSFMGDVRGHVKAIAGRSYIDPAANTLDFVLMFIPNEQIYAFIYESDSTVVEEALRRRVVLCSPLTLFMVLSVVRQAAQVFALQASTHEVLDVLNAFRKQWDAYRDQSEKVRSQLQTAIRSFDDLQGVRSRQLEKPLAEVDALIQARGLEDLAQLRD
jgi:DNA recombination protein RmuC